MKTTGRHIASGLTNQKAIELSEALTKAGIDSYANATGSAYALFVAFEEDGDRAREIARPIIERWKQGR